MCLGVNDNLKIVKGREKTISDTILTWSAQNPRVLPWKNTKDPYKIWISEIILQQTRVEQGAPYYDRFIKAFPSVWDLASADFDDVLKLWEGLGYYRRAKHLHETAKVITTDYAGIFPNTYNQIKALKGIGPYTAAAVSSFAFDLPHAVIDGNVMRVVARLFNIRESIDSRDGKRNIEKHTKLIFAPDKAAAFNQAIMDFGAMQCVPANPTCDRCVLKTMCGAFQRQLVSQIPGKKLKRTKKKRYFYYVILNRGKDVWLRKRAKQDIWQHLYEFHLIERDKPTVWSDLEQSIDLKTEIVSISDIYQQTLTHQKIYATFVEVNYSGPPEVLLQQGFQLSSRKQIRKFTFPKIIDCYLLDKSVNLNLAL